MSEIRKGRQPSAKSIVLPYTESYGQEAIALYNDDRVADFCIQPTLPPPTHPWAQCPQNAVGNFPFTYFRLACQTLYSRTVVDTSRMPMAMMPAMAMVNIP